MPCLSRSSAGTCIAPICIRFCRGRCTAKVCPRTPPPVLRYPACCTISFSPSRNGIRIPGTTLRCATPCCSRLCRCSSSRRRSCSSAKPTARQRRIMLEWSALHHRFTRHLHQSCVVSLRAHGAAGVCPRGTAAGARVVRVARRSAGRLHRHRFSHAQPQQNDGTGDPALRAASSSHARPSRWASICCCGETVPSKVPRWEWTQYAQDFSHHPRGIGPNYAWAAAMAVARNPRCAFHPASAARRSAGVRLSPAARRHKPFSMQTQTLHGTQLRYIAFTMNGYHLVSADSRTHLGRSLCR